MTNSEPPPLGQRWRGGLGSLRLTRTNPRRRRDLMAGLGFLAPSFLILLIFVIIPVIAALFLSFARWEVRSSAPRFIGLGNYLTLMAGQELWRAARNTLYFTALKIPLDMGLSLGVALSLNQGLRGLSFYRTAYFMPVITSAVAVSAVWRLIYNPNFGLANRLLELLHLSPQTWLSDPDLAMPSVTLVALWKGLGYNVVIFLAGLQTIPREFYEAAELDGATRWQRFRHITLPLLSPVTYFVFVIGIINSFKVFSIIHVLTPDGGPLKSTEVLVYLIYRLAFQDYSFGRAAAVAFVLFAMVIAITVVQRRFIEARVYYG